MSISEARNCAREQAYQWRQPCWIVLDVLARALVVFCGPHEEYLKSEPGRYFPVEIHHPEGAAESAVSA
jgi:hypothetical protein